MSLITGSIKDILSIKMKYRHDDFSDQFSRIFMTKMLVISSLIMGVDFFSDKVSCIVPSDSHLSRDFVHSACWIQGFYVYDEMKHRSKESGYFGIPKDVELDGITANGKLCRRINKATHLLDPDCQPMTKSYYLQFQYFPFYVATLAVLYYLPYVVFRLVNADMISLRSNIKSINAGTMNATKIVKSYFDYSMNGGIKKLRTKILLNIFIKFLYVFVSILGFVATDSLLNNNYKTYGTEWISWSHLNNSMAYDYSGIRNYPKPGDFLLPPIGFCEITEGLKDVRTSFTNLNKFICEISPNILYQYVLIVLWFLFVISIAVAILGLVVKILYLWMMSEFGNKKKLTDVVRKMTLRETEYLNYIRIKNLPLYGDVLYTLKKERASSFMGKVNDTETEELAPCRNNLVIQASQPIITEVYNP